jgi:hypothetical protein
MSEKTYYYQAGLVKPGNVYRHFKGGVYVVLSVSLDSEYVYDLDKREVSYLNLNTGITYHRDLNEFVTPKTLSGGLEQERFTHIGEATVTVDEGGKYIVTRKY